MEKRRTGLKIAALTAALAAMMIVAGCGQDEDEKIYLDEIKAEDYVKLPEYKGLHVVQALPEVTDEYRDAYINYYLSLNPPEGAKEGDTVNIDYVGTLDGVAFEGGTAAGQNLTLGSGQFIEGFEEGLIGAKAGDVVDLNLTFPENYRSTEMAGKSVVFTVTVNTVMAAEPQELTDEYVKGLDNGCSTVEEYKQYAYDLLMEDAEVSYEKAIENSLVNMLMESCEFTKEPPQAMVEGYTSMLKENLTAEAANYGLTLEQFISVGFGTDAETFAQEIQEQAKQYARQYIMLQAIADREGLNVTDEDVDKEIEELTAENGGDMSVEEIKEEIDNRRYKEYMMSQKVMEMLRENAVVSAE
ncbi:trigger factor [Lachnospiraceae bacterium]|nr:trigger factor [Lachnospiraceae bacterium]